MMMMINIYFKAGDTSCSHPPSIYYSCNQSINRSMCTIYQSSQKSIKQIQSLNKRNGVTYHITVLFDSKFHLPYYHNYRHYDNWSVTATNNALYCCDTFRPVRVYVYCIWWAVCPSVRKKQFDNRWTDFREKLPSHVRFHFCAQSDGYIKHIPIYIYMRTSNEIGFIQRLTRTIRASLSVWTALRKTVYVYNRLWQLAYCCKLIAFHNCLEML
jgi:hypothetical protein